MNTTAGRDHFQTPEADREHLATSQHQKRAPFSVLRFYRSTSTSYPEFVYGGAHEEFIVRTGISIT